MKALVCYSEHPERGFQVYFFTGKYLVAILQETIQNVNSLQISSFSVCFFLCFYFSQLSRYSTTRYSLYGYLRVPKNIYMIFLIYYPNYIENDRVFSYKLWWMFWFVTPGSHIYWKENHSFFLIDELKLTKFYWTFKIIFMLLSLMRFYLNVLRLYLNILRLYLNRLRLYLNRLRLYLNRLRLYFNRLTLYLNRLRLYLNRLKLNLNRLRLYLNSLRLYLIRLILYLNRQILY